jgi:hypothetical protein
LTALMQASGTQSAPELRRCQARMTPPR